MKQFIPDTVSKHDNVYDVLKERGFIEQSTNEEEVRKIQYAAQVTRFGQNQTPSRNFIRQ